jgi:hypothetical protein
LSKQRSGLVGARVERATRAGALAEVQRDRDETGSPLRR